MTLEQIEGLRAAVDAALNEAFSRMSKGQTVDSSALSSRSVELVTPLSSKPAYAALDAAQPQ